jgi:hypothetical protein
VEIWIFIGLLAVALSLDRGLIAIANAIRETKK